MSASSKKRFDLLLEIMETLNLVVLYWIEFGIKHSSRMVYYDDSRNCSFYVFHWKIFPYKYCRSTFCPLVAVVMICARRGNRTPTPNTKVERNAFPENCKGLWFTECVSFSFGLFITPTQWAHLDGGGVFLFRTVSLYASFQQTITSESVPLIEFNIPPNT